MNDGGFHIDQDGDAYAFDDNGQPVPVAQPGIWSEGDEESLEAKCLRLGAERDKLWRRFGDWRNVFELGLIDMLDGHKDSCRAKALALLTLSLEAEPSDMAERHGVSKRHLNREIANLKERTRAFGMSE